MRFLLSNDDGYQAAGLHALARELAALGSVTVVAPDRNRSGASNSLTLDMNRPLTVDRADNGFYYVNGTPTDCVHLALTGLLDEMPEMVIAGINHGANLGDDVLYSGTVAAAMEGRFLDKPALAFSLAGDAPRHFDAAATMARRFIERLLRRPPPPDLFRNLLLNINIPDAPLERMQSFCLARLGARHRAARTMSMQAPHGKTLYWIGPPGDGAKVGPGTDFHAVEQNRVAVTPLQLDLTRYDGMEAIQGWMSAAGFHA